MFIKAGTMSAQNVRRRLVRAEICRTAALEGSFWYLKVRSRGGGRWARPAQARTPPSSEVSAGE